MESDPLTPSTGEVIVASATSVRGGMAQQTVVGARGRLDDRAGRGAVGDPPSDRDGLARAALDIGGLLFVVAAAVAVMLPALIHGASLGPFDLLSRYGVSKQPGVTIHNSQTTDLIAQMIPWTSLAWTQVHSGHLPLWNPYNGLGMPLAFNWQSATFGVPTLLGYLAPLRYAYTVQVMVTLVLAGTGTYVLGRVLRLSVTACVMAGVVYELSGTFMGFLGWPIASVMAWAGWLFAAALLIVRGQRRVRAVVFFALAVAGAIYAGQPDALVLLAPGLLVFVVVLLIARARSEGMSRSSLRPISDIVVASIAGGALGAPLILPGIPLTTGSVFYHAAKANGALAAHDVVNLVFQGYNALPVAQGHWFGVGTSAYVGVIALVMALTGAVVCRHKPEVLAFVIVGVVMGALVFLPPVASLMNDLPFRARWHLGLVVVTFVLAILAGYGTDVVIRSPRDWTTRVWCGSGFGVVGLIVVALWFIGRGHLAPHAARLRTQSFIWPTVLVILGLVVVALLSRGAGQPGAVPSNDTGGRVGTGRLVAWVFLVAQTAFLVGVGTPLWSSSPTFLTPTPGVIALTTAVGASTVGFGAHSCELPPTLGILPETNAAFGVHELSAYDPITPRSYFRALKLSPGILVSAFCPVVRSVAEARRYGVEFILEAKGTSSPVGAVFDRAIGDEDLYRVPGAGAATLTAVAGGKLPAVDAPGTPLSVTYPGPGSWRIVTKATGPQVLRLRLTDVPGWHASIDGRPLTLERFSGIMLQAHIPPGSHVVELHYWPETFTIGLLCAGGSGAGLAIGAVVGWKRRRVATGPGAMRFPAQ
jgi:hypothetical protein